MKNTRELLTEHYKKYPKLELRDFFKFIHQSSFGCEHWVSSLDTAQDYIKEEYKTISSDALPLIEHLDGNYSRVHLSYLKKGLSEETLGKLFYLSSRKEENGKEELLKKLDVLKELIYEKELPFDMDEFKSAVSMWSKNEYQAVHHSDTFRAEYKPAYRIVANEYIPYLPLFINIDKMLKEGQVNMAIEGGSASGKTTLSKLLSEIYDCNIFHADDFFLRPEQRIPERFKEVGGNLDRERLLSEVLEPLSNGENICYRRFDCKTLTICEPVTYAPKRFNIIEGAYSMHPELKSFYNFSVFLEVSSDLQIKRINKRNTPDMAERFFNEWIPLENIYFKETKIKEKCDLCIRIQ